MSNSNSPNHYERNILLIAILLAVITLIIVPSIRFFNYNSSQPGELPYYNSNLAEYISEKGIPSTEPFINRPYILQPYHLVLSAAFSLASQKFAQFLLPFMLGILSVIIFYLILKELKLEPFKKALILLLTITSPVFIYTFSTSNQHSLSLFILLLGFYFFIKESKSSIIISSILFALLSFFSIFHAIAAILLSVSHLLNKKIKAASSYIPIAVIAATSLAYWIYLLQKHGLPQLVLLKAHILKDTLSVFGAELGFSEFTLLLALIGCYIAWKTKKQQIPYAFIFLLAVLSLYFAGIKIYLNMVFASFAGIGFYTIITSKWKLKPIKTLTIIIMVFGILFSSLSYINRLSSSQPDNNLIESLNWLKENSDKDDIVFSYYKNGFWIESIAKRQVLLDSHLEYIPDLDSKLNITHEIFYSRNLKKTASLLGNSSLSYILITPEMLDSQVWTAEQQGLMFLFRNNETFKKVYSQEGIEIWEYLG